MTVDIVELRRRHVDGWKPRQSVPIVVSVLAELLNELELLRATPEVVICAAIRLPDGRIFRGHRHADCIRTAHELIEYRFAKGYEEHPYDAYRDGIDQGFMTSCNRFVGREEGRRLQEAAGIESVARGGYRGDLLFSEDLY